MILCVRHYSQHITVLFALLSGWATTTVRLLGPKMGSDFPTDTATCYHKVKKHFDYQPGTLSTNYAFFFVATLLYLRDK